RSGTDVLSVADGKRHCDVLLGQGPTPPRQSRQRKGVHCQGPAPAPPAQGIPALPRSGKLAAVARHAETDGARRSDRLWQEATDPAPPAGQLAIVEADAKYATDADSAYRPAPQGTVAGNCGAQATSRFANGEQQAQQTASLKM